MNQDHDSERNGAIGNHPLACSQTQPTETIAITPKEIAMNDNDAIETTPRTLRFTCPSCGGHNLQQYDNTTYNRACKVSVWLKDESDPDTVQIDEDSEPFYEPIGDSEDDPGWCCADCGGVLYENGSPVETESSLAEWLLEHCPQNNPSEDLDFTCPLCGSNRLDQPQIDIEKSEPVVALGQTEESGETEAGSEVALSCDRIQRAGKSIRYGCSNGHELTKDDGSPVESQEELVEWLKGHQPAVEG